MSLTAALITRRTAVITAVPVAMLIAPHVGAVIEVVGAIPLVTMLAHPETTGALLMPAVKVVISVWAVSTRIFTYSL